MKVIIADPPWSFSDRLQMSDVKRGADANYQVLSNEDIKALPVEALAGEDAVLALWVPSSLLSVGLDVMLAWGFEQKQTVIWVKTKKIVAFIEKVGEILGFGMGRLFRQTHEIVLIGTRGNVYDKLSNKSQRSVHFGSVTKHSAKPYDLHTSLSLMFPKAKKIEIFARRDVKGWKCLGNQCPSTMGEDIRVSLEKLISKKALSLFKKQKSIKLEQADALKVKLKTLLTKDELKLIEIK